MTLTIRQAATGDLDTLVGHRRAMFLDMGYRDTAALEAMSAKFRPWLERKMKAGAYLAWVIVDERGSIVAGAGLWLMEWPPHMVGAGDVRGNIVNVYTNVEYRRRGLARQLMAVVLDWCRKQRLDTVVLHASKDGLALYESMGFTATNEMRLMLE